MAKAHGTALTDGQMAEPDGKGPVGVADPSWLDPGDRVNFPYVGTDGDSSLIWVGRVFRELWRWFVKASK